MLSWTVSCVVSQAIQLTYSISVIIAAILGFVARHFADLSSSASSSNSTFALAPGMHFRTETYIGVLSCSNIDAGNNPIYFPSQDFLPQSTIVNGLAAQPLNFHLEPLYIGNLFQSPSFRTSLTRRRSRRLQLVCNTKRGNITSWE
jgi:hypothetical protein